MKKILYIFLGIIVIHFVYFIFFRKIENPRFDLYFNNQTFYKSKINYFYILGKLPNSYYKEFEEQIIFQNEKLKVTNIKRIKIPMYHNYLIYKDLLLNREYILKNSDSAFYYNSDTKNILSRQFDLNILNKYLNVKWINNKDEIIKTFCFLNSTIDGDNSYIADKNDTLPNFLIIKDLIDFNKILINRTHIESELKINKDLLFENEETTYCWFKNKGLYKINIQIEQDSIVTINDEFLGYTGSEK